QIDYHRHVYRTYGKIAAFAQGSSKVLIYGPEYNRHVLSQPDVFHAGGVPLPGSSDSVLYRLATGLPTMNGDLHRRQRRLLQPAFHRQQVETYRDTMVAITQHFLDRWPIGHVLDIVNEMHQITLCVASETLYGVDARAAADTLGHLMARWIGLNANWTVHMFPVDAPGTPFRRLLRLSEDLEAHIRAIIQRKRAHLSEQQDALALLLQAQDDDGTRLTEAELIGHANVLFFTGFETTAVALTWTLFLLVQHPRIMADLLDELTSTLHGDAPTLAQIHNLPLLDHTIKESLRILPPAIQGGRTAMQPFAMGGYEFPAGTKVMYSEYMTHHMPDLYPEPEKFSPERWRDLEPAPYAYIPFLVGARRCLGAEFALLEMKIVLSLILQRYRLTMAPHTRVDRQVRFMLVPKPGMPMRVVAQDRQFTKVPVRGNIHETVDLS
ncbi:MAG: cytochrome P450, partial [Roseiflexaceae bacterium]